MRLCCCCAFAVQPANKLEQYAIIFCRTEYPMDDRDAVEYSNHLCTGAVFSQLE
jgi:hypothetical protein